MIKCLINSLTFSSGKLDKIMRGDICSYCNVQNGGGIDTISEELLYQTLKTFY